MAEEARRLEAEGLGSAHVVPEGGSDALGAWGYVRCAEEVAAAERAAETAFDLVVCASGSGGTQAGLVAGRALLGRPWDVLGFAVCDDRAYFERKVRAIVDDMAAREPRLRAAGAAVRVEDGYVGRGYALSRPDELLTIARVARLEGVLLDPVYTGKAMHGLLEEARAGRVRRGARVLFIHTGGVFGLFPKAAELGAALGA
jgi:D-cysteine desulfhydrase